MTPTITMARDAGGYLYLEYKSGDIVSVVLCADWLSNYTVLKQVALDFGFQDFERPRCSHCGSDSLLTEVSDYRTGVSSAGCHETTNEERTICQVCGEIQ